MNNKDVVINIAGDYIKLDAFLKFSGACTSGGQAKEVIIGGRVLVNGAVCPERGKKLRAGDSIIFDGRTYTVNNANP